MCKDWTPTDKMIESVAIEIIRKYKGASRINPISIALECESAKTILIAAHDKIPEIVHGLINA